MRAPSSAIVLALTLVSAFSLGACGKLKPADTSGAAGSTGTAGSTGAAGSTTGAGGTTNVLVTISGTAAPHPLNAALLAGQTLDFSMLKVSIVDPAAVILNPNATPLGSMALDTSTGNCDATNGCKWMLTGVNITNPNLLGLVGTLEDTRTGDARVWVKTGTGMGTMADVGNARMNPGSPITDRRAFIVSRALEAKLGAFLGPALGTTFAPGDLEARGFLIGHVVGKVSLGAMPVAGAKVAATGPFDYVYPNADFSGVGTTTSANGLFLMVPKEAKAVVASWDVVPPAGDTRTWETHLAGANPNNAFVIILQASE